MDAQAWLSSYREETQQRLTRAEEAQQQVRSATGSARSADGAVSLTVGATGALTALELSPRACQLGRTELAALILRTSKEAHRKAAEQLAQAVRPLAGADSAAMDFLRSHIAAAEAGEAGTEQCRRPSEG